MTKAAKSGESKELSAEKMPAEPTSRAEEYEQELERRGVLALNQEQFEEFFDAQARKLVGISGQAALKCIYAGKVGKGLGWTELVLLSTLLAEE